MGACLGVLIGGRSPHEGLGMLEETCDREVKTANGYLDESQFILNQKTMMSELLEDSQEVGLKFVSGVLCICVYPHSNQGT